MEKRSIEFDIPGVPVGKGRPRAAKRGKHITLYTPEKTACYEGVVAFSGQSAMAGAALLDGALLVDMDIRIPVPESWSRNKRNSALAGLLMPTKKPDIDNIEKAIFDALNGVTWKDDVQVVRVTKAKRYAEVPGVRLRISEIGAGG